MILFTSDWQTHHTNLGNVETAVSQIERIASKTAKLDAIVHCGDVKHTLNPIDGRALNALVGYLNRLRKLAPVYVNLGNHDKLGMGDDSPNFFPLLREAGAVCFDEWDAVRVGDFRLFFLPYRNNPEDLAEDAKALALKQKPKKTDSILVFHAGVRRARVTVSHSYDGDDATTLDALQADSYAWVIGGHFHHQQKIGANGYYVGSPFCCDWGEANQTKGFLAVRWKGNRIVCEPLRSDVPGWYDPGLPEFEPPRDWAGTSVRIKVPVEKGVENVGEVIASATARAQTEYPGAKLVVIPEDVTPEVGEVVVRKTASDEEVIREFIGASLPKTLEGDDEKLVSYLGFKLGEAATLSRSSERFAFVELRGENVLSFETIRINYARPGLQVISGINYDWEERSNGSGKTSYLQVLLIAAFGRSIKGQTADRWMRRGIGRKEKSWVELDIRLADGRLLTIHRGRQPKRTLLTIDGKDFSSGMGDREIGITISTLTGMTFEILVNSLYVDQRELNRLLVGTDVERKAILSQFLNLERFGKAQLLIKEEAKKNAATITDHESALRVKQESLSEKREFLETLRNRRKADEAGIRERLESDRKKLDGIKNALKGAEDRRGKARAKLRKLQDEEKALGRAVAEVAGRVNAFRDQIEKIRKLANSGTCPVCKQAIDKRTMNRHISELETQAVEAEKAETDAKRPYRAKGEEATDALREYEKAGDAVSELETAKARLESAIEDAERSLRKMREKDADETGLKDQIAKIAAEVKGYERSLEGFRHEAEFLNYAVRCFSKDGVPAFIAARLCPRLNRSAAFYSRLFADGEIEVQFSLVGEDIDIAILNRHGGENLEDQSGGETRIASLIVSFALRDVSSLTDLLIADEPGEGLDERNARQFAAGLKELTDRFRTIFVTTHNPHVLSELSDQAQIVVEKRDGVSRIRKVRA